MNVLLIQSYLGGGDATLAFPLGLAYLSSCLDDHQIKILDLNLYQNPYNELVTKLAEFSPDIIGISLRNIDNQTRISLNYFYLEFKKTIRAIKKQAPDTPLVVGGAGFSMFAQKIMNRNSEIDFGVFQEGEESFSELLENVVFVTFSVPVLYITPPLVSA